LEYFRLKAARIKQLIFAENLFTLLRHENWFYLHINDLLNVEFLKRSDGEIMFHWVPTVPMTKLRAAMHMLSS
jgi:hypothetical protein